MFVVLSRQYLRAAFGSDWSNSRCDGLGALEEETPSHECGASGRQIVVLAEVLPDAVNTGYHDMKHRRLLTVDAGKGAVEVRNLQHLATALDDGDAPRLVFSFQHKRGCAQVTVVLDRARVQQAESRILSRARILSARHLGADSTV